MNQMITPTYDVLGIGFGPSNLALAIALQEQAQREGLDYHALFLDKQGDYRWHGNTLVAQSELQISFLKDLVSLRNPTSPYSFVNYLHRQGRLADFINLGTFYPCRMEFNDYLRWVARQFAERQRHPAMMLDETRLRRQHGHGRPRDIVVARSDQFLQKGADDRVDIAARLQLQRQPCLDGQRVDMREKPGVAGEVLHQRIFALGHKQRTILDPRSFGLSVEQLPRNIEEHASHTRDYLVAEQRQVVVDEQVPQDRRCGRQHCVALRELRAQHRFHRFERRFSQGRSSHRSALPAQG